jgi:glycosyltransferase involved in cell wall biosynthesis
MRNRLQYDPPVIRLLFLIPTLDRSGAEKQLVLLATRLPRAEFEVHVACLTRGGPLERDLANAGIPVTVLHKRFRCDPVAWLRLRRLLGNVAPNILHTWLFAANAYGRLAAGKSAGFPIVVSERCVDTWKSCWQLWLDRRLAGRAAALVGNSQSVCRFYQALGVPAERMRVISNAVEVPTAVMSKERARAGLGLGAAPLVLGYIGRLARQKRVMDLVWAFELIRVMEGDVLFLIAGDGPERARLQHFARSLQIEERVRFLGHQEDVSAILPALDVFWLASDFEGLSNSLMEAMAFGVPVVASDIPPNRELIEHDRTGYLVPVGDRVAFAQFARKLLLEPQTAARLGQAGRQRMREEFSVPKMVESYQNLYRELASSRR